MPSACLRVFSSPRPLDCPLDCPGLQQDGGCLTQIVRLANAAGVEWEFELDREGNWIYCGAPL